MRQLLSGFQRLRLQMRQIETFARRLLQRASANEALRESEARIQALLSAFPDMILELSPDGRVIHMVPPKGFETSMPADRFIGEQLSEVFSETTALQTVLAMQRAIASNQTQVFEFETEMGGTPRVMEARLVRSASNTVLMLIRDIT